MLEKYLKSAIFLALYPLAMLASNLHEFIALSQNNESYLIKQMQSEQANLDKEQAFRNYLPSLSLNSAYVANNKDPSLSIHKKVYLLKFLLIFCFLMGVLERLI